MSRLSTANTNVTGQSHVPYCVFVDLAFDSGHVRLCSGFRSYTFTDATGSNTYAGLGKFGSIDSVRESGQLVPEKVQLTLSGVDNSLLSSALAENYHGRSVTIYVGYLTDVGDLADTPYLLWEGRMSVMTIRTDVNVSVIQMIAENRLIFWNKSPGWLYTNEHQQLLMGAGDNFFDQLSVIQNRPLKWGDFTVAPTAPIYPGPQLPPPGSPILPPGGITGGA